MSKDKNKKTTCPKNYMLSEIEVAQIAGCSVSYVKKLRSASVKVISKKAQQIIAIDIIANEGKNRLIEKLQQIVNF